MGKNPRVDLNLNEILSLRLCLNQTSPLGLDWTISALQCAKAGCPRRAAGLPVFSMQEGQWQGNPAIGH